MQKSLGLMLTGHLQKLRLTSQAVQAKLWIQLQLFSTASMYVLFLWSPLSPASASVLMRVHVVPHDM